MEDTSVVLVVIGGIILLLVFAVVMRFFGLWIQCVTTRADISLLNLILMRLRKVNPTVIVRSKIMATQAQLSKVYSISRQQLEAHYLAGGNVPNVIRALVASNRARLTLDFDTAAVVGQMPWRSQRTLVLAKKGFRISYCLPPSSAFVVSW